MPPYSYKYNGFLPFNGGNLGLYYIYKHELKAYNVIVAKLQLKPYTITLRNPLKFYQPLAT